MIDVIGWTLVHAAWEGGVIAIVAALALWMTRRASAATRYLIALSALGLMVAAPVATTLFTIHRSAPLNAERGPFAIDATPAVSSAAPAASTMRVAVQRTRAAASPSLTSRAGSLRVHIDRALPWLVAAWLLGIALLSLRTCVGVMHVWRLGHRGISAVAGELREVAGELAQRLGIRAAVRIVQSARVDVPMVVGWIEPMVLVPISLLASAAPAQLEMMIAHELAHIRRYDTIVNLAQTSVETLLFFHPAAWWTSARVREERENCCDDLAILVSGADRVRYGTMLLMLEESRASLALSAAANGGPLRRRVERIILGPNSRVELGGSWFAAVATLLVVLVIAVPRHAPAASVPAPASATSAASVPSGPSGPSGRSSAASPSSMTSPIAMHATPVVQHPTRSTPMPRRSLALGAALTLAATAAGAQRVPNISGRWVSYDSVSGKPQETYTLEQTDRALKFVQDSGSITFEIAEPDSAGALRVRGPIAGTMIIKGVEYAMTVTRDTVALNAQWRSGHVDFALAAGPKSGLIQVNGRMTLWLDTNGDLLVVTETPQDNGPVKRSVARYHR
ncbi:MAG TPA: M56 family metallopeptidase [Gemmatimonadaceae bacterium]|nr:M56 family metallopeptidase [Gemmatimonadaceae bacterium]